jgi:hypothetical protein
VQAFGSPIVAQRTLFATPAVAGSQHSRDWEDTPLTPTEPFGHGVTKNKIGVPEFLIPLACPAPVKKWLKESGSLDDLAEIVVDF